MPLPNVWPWTALPRIFIDHLAFGRDNECWDEAGALLSAELVTFDPIEELRLLHWNTKFGIEPLRISVFLVGCPFYAVPLENRIRVVTREFSWVRRHASTR